MRLIHGMALACFLAFAAFLPAAEGDGDPAPRAEHPAGKRITVTVKRYGAPESAWSTAKAVIAAGGVDNTVHRCEIKIVPEGFEAGDPLDVRLVGGAGHAAGRWPFNTPAVPAHVQFGLNASLSAGEAITLGADTEHSGVLRSSNKAETAKLVVSGGGVTKSVDIEFSGGDLKIEIDGEMMFPGVPRAYTVTHTLDDKPIVGHNMKVVVKEVDIVNADDEEETLRASLGDDENDSVTLDDYVELDPGAIYDHRYFAGTTDTEGLTSTLKVVDGRVTGARLEVFDFNVWE